MLVQLFLFGVVCSCLFIFLLFKLISSSPVNYDYFKKRNLKCMESKTLWRLMIQIYLKKLDATDLTQLLYKSFPDEPISGNFDFRVPQYIVRDPEAIKRICIKDFEYFEDHRALTDKQTDKLWGNSLFFLNGQTWRQMRATLSPAFTGSKMRQMFELVVECAEDVVDYYQKCIANGEKVNVEMKEFFSRYSNDVIASCAFGLKVNSFADPNNDFYLNGKQIMNFAGIKFLIKSMVIGYLPAVARVLKLSLLDTSIASSFKETILDTMEVRKRNNIYRPDMINILMQIREGTLNHQTDDIKNTDTAGFATVEESDVGKVLVNRTWNNDELVAQAFLFWVAGFETTSTLLTFVSYELMANQDIQQKLYDEITEMNEHLGGNRLTYDALQKMKYLDQVISETLRKWPPAVQIDRRCIKNYQYNDGKLNFIMEKGSTYLFPVYSLHHDPKYFPEPEKFDPERFNDENKNKIVPFTYLPFGTGPRNCIGSRFALMEIKAILYHLLLNFTFEPNEKSQIPMKLKKTVFNLLPENGMHLELKARK